MTQCVAVFIWPFLKQNGTFNLYLKSYQIDFSLVSLLYYLSRIDRWNDKKSITFLKLPSVVIKFVEKWHQ